MSTDVDRPAVDPEVNPAGAAAGPFGGCVLSPTSLRFLPVHAVDTAPPAETGSLRALFESILQWGIVQPLIVRRSGARYEVLAGRKRFAAAVAAGLSEVPCLVFDGSEADGMALAATTNVGPPSPPTAPSPVPSAMFLAVVSELHATRAAIAGSVALADSRSGGLRQHVARELVDVELQRSAWMLDGLLVFKSSPSDRRTAVSVGPLLRAVASGFHPECRLGGIDVRLHVDPSELVVYANEGQVRAALQCVMGALLTTMHGERHPDARLLLQARPAGGAVMLSVVQNVVAFQKLARLRGARRGEADDPEGALAVFGFDAARRVVEAHGGRLEVRPDQASAGCAVDLTLPSSE